MKGAKVPTSVLYPCYQGGQELSPWDSRISDLNTKYPMNLMVHELTYSLPLPRSWLKHNIYEELDPEEILSLGEAEDP